MSSTSEQGHIKIVTGFNHLINACIGFGPAYNPTNPGLLIPALQSNHTGALTNFDNVRAGETAIDNIINGRKNLFIQMFALSTRIVNSLDSTQAPDLLIRDARTHLNKIRGKRAVTTPPPVNPDDAAGIPTISVSQRSFDALIQHFQSLVSLALSEPSYNPNEPDLQAAGLNAYIASLQAANNDESGAKIALSLAVIARNQALYAPQTGLCHIAQEVKKYIKSVFGAASPEYKLVAAIKFKTRKI